MELVPGNLVFTGMTVYTIIALPPDRDYLGAAAPTEFGFSNLSLNSNILQSSAPVYSSHPFGHPTYP